MVEGDRNVAQRELEGVAHPHQRDLLPRGAQRSELGSLGHQRRDRPAEVGRLRGQNGHAKVEVLDHQTNGVLVDLIGFVADPADGDGAVGHIAVAVAVLQVGAAHTHKGLHIACAKLDAVGPHAGDVAQDAGVDRDVARAAAAEGKVALQVDKLRHHEGGVADPGLDGGTRGKVQEDGGGTGGHGQALWPEAGLEIDRGNGFGRALPAVAPVHHHLDVAALELEDVAAADHTKIIGRGPQRGELGRFAGKAAGRREDGQCHVDIGDGQTKAALLLVHRHPRVEVGDAVADEEVGVLDAQGHGLDLEVGDGGPVRGHIGAGGGERGHRTGKRQVAKAGAGVDRDALALALLKGKSAAHIHKLADLNGGLLHVHAEERAGEVQGDRIAAGGHQEAGRAISGLEVDIGLDLGVVPRVRCLVGRDADLPGLQREEVHADHADAVDGGRQGPHVRDILVRVRVHDQRQVEVVDRKAHRIGRGFVLGGDPPVAIAVDKIRTGPYKQHRVREAQGDGVHRQVLDARIAPRLHVAVGHQVRQGASGGGRGVGEAGDNVHCGGGRGDREAALDEEEVAQRDARAADLGTEEAAAVVEEDGRVAGLHPQALGAKARTQVGVGRHRQAAPVAAGVQAQRDVVDGQLHEAPVEVQRDGPVGAHGVETRHHTLGIHRFGGAEGGKRHVDALQVHQRVVGAADLDRHVGGAKQDRVDRQIVEAAVVGRQIALALEVAQVGVERRGAATESGRQLGVDVQGQTAALLEGEVALDEEEAPHTQHGVVQGDADQGTVVVEDKAALAHAEHQGAAVEAAGEVDEGPRVFGARPQATAVERNLQRVHLELEQHPVDVELGVPVDLHRVEVGDDAVGVGGIGRVHEHQPKIDVLQRDAPGVLVEALARVEQTVAVVVDEIGAQTHKHIHIGGGQEGGGRFQTLDAAVVCRHALHLGQAVFDGRVGVELVDREAGADVDAGRLGLLEIETATDVDVVGNGQGGAVDGQAQHLTASGVGADRDRLAGAGRHLEGVECHHAAGAALDAVHLQRDAGGRQGEAVDADKGHALGRGRQRAPAGACGIGTVEQHQPQVHPAERQAQAVVAAATDASKSLAVAHADGQSAAGQGLAVGQLDLGVPAGDADTARDLDEAEQVNLDLAAELGDVACRAVQGEGHLAVWASGHRQLGAAGVAVVAGRR